MEIRAQSIDHAAGGFLRHRFLREVSGAAFVILVLGVAGLAATSGVALALMAGTKSSDVMAALKSLGLILLIAAASAATLAAAFLVALPRLSAFGTAWREDLAARRWREAAVGTLIAVVAAAATALALYGAAKSSLDIARVLFFLVLILAGFVAGIVLGVLVASAVFMLVQSLWRRLFALLLLGAWGLLLAGLVSASPSVLGTAPGLIPMISAAVAVLVGGLITLEFFGQAFWQLTISHAGFRAARGWRPPIHHILTGVRRNFGLPGFLAHFGRARYRLAGLYFLVALFNALTFVCFGLILFLLVIWNGNPVLQSLASLVLSAAIYGSFRAGAHFARLATAETTTLYQTVREWDERAPIVFLRNFNQDDNRVPVRTIDPILKAMAGVGQPQTLDEILLEHATPYGPVLAIGDPRTKTPPLGAARIFVEGSGTEWQPVVDGLCSASSAIVMCPTSTEGVRWELDLLTRHDLYARTIYLANPEIDETESLALFEKMSAGRTLSIPKKKTPIAAFHDPKTGWRVLAARRRTTQTYTVALNLALQAILGIEGVRPPKKPPKPKPRGRKTPAVTQAA